MEYPEIVAQDAAPAESVFTQLQSLSHSRNWQLCCISMSMNKLFIYPELTFMWYDAEIGRHARCWAVGIRVEDDDQSTEEDGQDGRLPARHGDKVSQTDCPSRLSYAPAPMLHAVNYTCWDLPVTERRSICEKKERRRVISIIWEISLQLAAQVFHEKAAKNFITGYLNTQFL